MSHECESQTEPAPAYSDHIAADYTATARRGESNSNPRHEADRRKVDTRLRELLMRAARRAVIGAKWGLLMAALLSAWVLILAAFNGSLTFATPTGESYFAPAIIAFYCVGGATSGAMLGLLGDLMRWRVGAWFVGMLAAAPLAMAFLIMEGRFEAMGRREVLFVVAFCAAFGGGGGMIVREFVRGKPPQRVGRREEE